MLKNDTFYPTPRKLAARMIIAVDWKNVNTVLEPSAGDGALVKEINERLSRVKISCIEKDPDLQSILRGKGYSMLDSDFLQYQGMDRFDLIMMNPPFNEGATHLNKALDMMFSGQIVCLLNAETLRNRGTNDRERLWKRLQAFGDDCKIEYLNGAFLEAERKTEVDVALVYIRIKGDISVLLFDGCEDKAGNKESIKMDAGSEVASGRSIDFLLEDYDKTCREGIELMQLYFRNHGRVSPFIKLSCVNPDGTCSLPMINSSVNAFLTEVRKGYWKKLLNTGEVHNKMTKATREQFLKDIDSQTMMEFSYGNIRQFILNLTTSYGSMLDKAVDDVFETMTAKYSWNVDTASNKYLYDGWKTNQAWFCNKKVVLPVRSSWKFVFNDFFSGKKWELADSRALEGLTGDIDKVMNFFDTGKGYISIVDAVRDSLKKGVHKNIVSTYFTINVYKKNTIHLVFNSEDIRRRFNIAACMGRKWLPPSYGKKTYAEMDCEEKAVIDSFEGEKSYSCGMTCIGYVQKEVAALIGNNSTR